MKIICLVNKKGGIAKTTTSVSVGAILAELGHKVLLVDMDPQGNLTESVGLEAKELKNTMYEVLTEEMPLKEAIHKTDYGVDIVPANIRLANTETAIVNNFNREYILKKSVENSGVEYDYMILDLPPSLGLLSINALTVSDYAMIPLDAGAFALSGVEQLISIIKLVKSNLNPDLDILGTVLTKADDRLKITKEMKEAIEEIFGDRFFKTVIHQNSKIMDSQKENMPINYYDKTSRGYKEYLELTKEVVERVGK